MSEDQSPIVLTNDLRIRQAAIQLNRGAVIAYPTEGVWGLGCDPANEQAVYHILGLKSRPVEKGLILVSDCVERLAPYFRDLPNADDLEFSHHPITWLVNHGGMAPYWVTGEHKKLAVRISTHPTVRALCARSGVPLVSTSANPAGKPSAKTALRVRTYFGNLIDVIVPGALGGQNGASEIRDLQTGAVLRPAGTQ